MENKHFSLLVCFKNLSINDLWSQEIATGGLSSEFDLNNAS